MKRTNDSESTNSVKSQKVDPGQFNLQWHHHGEKIKGIQPLMYLAGDDVKPSDKVAGFDMDDALITTKSGKTFATGPKDWKWLNDNVVEKLASLYSDGYKIVLFTNQAGIEKKKTDPAHVKAKAFDIMDGLGFPFQMFVATGENIYRKPAPTMWTFMEEKCNGGIRINLNESLFVGDAAGRSKNWAPGRRKDFSCSDRKFAANVGVKFQTPEEFYNNEKPCTNFEWGSIDPKTVLDSTDQSTDYHSLASTNQEMIIFVGFPGSGKSTFAKTYLEPKGYEVVNRDLLKTQDKCLKRCSEGLEAKKSIAIDNTNPSLEARKPYISLAKKLGVAVRCFHMQASRELSHHLNMYRQARSGGAQRRVPDVGYNMFKSKFQPPQLSEGFDEVKLVEFFPRFESDADKKLFKMWT